MTQVKLDDLREYASITRMPLDLARDMAMAEDGEILLISGSIPMDIGYPDTDHKDILQLANLTTMGDVGRKIALYRVLNRRRLHEVIDYMENHGGYRCHLVKNDGTLDQGYYL